jgi:hypothetical protein
MEVVALAFPDLNFWPRKESDVTEYETACSSPTTKSVIIFYFA